MSATTIALALAGLAVGAVAVMLVLQGRGSAAQRIQQQLDEVRSRLDALASSSGELPRSVAEGAALQARSLADVKENLGRLAEATARLEVMGRSVTEVRDLLRVPHLRGTIGEVWLEELLRQVFPPSRFAMQYTFPTGERVDAAVFVGDRIVPIDAKFPLDACQRMMEADAATAPKERRAFRRALRERIDEIADKYVRPGEGTFDFALMYVPAEAVYYEAVVREEPNGGAESVVEYALGRHVLPVSPHTFYALLTVLLHGLRGIEVEQGARRILDALRALELQLDEYRKTMELVGRHLDNASRQFRESQRLWERVSLRVDALSAIGADDGAGDDDAFAAADHDERGKQGAEEVP
jgi:DNA recombination protein RmuC